MKNRGDSQREGRDPQPPEPGSSDDIYAEESRDGSDESVHVTKADLSPDELVRHLRRRETESRYEPRGEIARGGMGAVLRIWDKNLDRPLAMKVILGQADRTGDTPPAESAKVARFLEEAQVTGQLDHPGIVPVHEVGLDAEGRVFFTMRLVKGRDFSEILDETGKKHELLWEEGEWTLNRALEVILKVCDAMAYAHTKGVIHRDLKPLNIRVGRFGEVYVMDWGLARVLGEDDRRDIRIRSVDSTAELKTERSRLRDETPETPLVTMDGDVVGTPAYMPPEQARGDIDEIDQRADVYAIGAILYHLLAGQTPYVPAGATRVSARTILMRVLEGPPPTLRSVNTYAPGELVDICEKAMAREPDNRYANTEELADDIRSFLARKPIAARGTSFLYPIRLAVARNFGIVATIFMAAVLGLIGVVFTVLMQKKTLREAVLEVEMQLPSARSEFATGASARASEFQAAFEAEMERHDEYTKTPDGLGICRDAQVTLTRQFADAEWGVLPQSA